MGIDRSDRDSCHSGTCHSGTVRQRRRLGLAARISHLLSTNQMAPALSDGRELEHQSLRVQRHVAQRSGYKLAR